MSSLGRAPCQSSGCSNIVAIAIAAMWKWLQLTSTASPLRMTCVLRGILPILSLVIVHLVWISHAVSCAAHASLFRCQEHRCDALPPVILCHFLGVEARVRFVAERTKDLNYRVGLWRFHCDYVPRLLQGRSIFSSSPLTIRSFGSSSDSTTRVSRTRSQRCFRSFTHSSASSFVANRSALPAHPLLSAITSGAQLRGIQFSSPLCYP